MKVLENKIKTALKRAVGNYGWGTRTRSNINVLRVNRDAFGALHFQNLLLVEPAVLVLFKSNKPKLKHPHGVFESWLGYTDSNRDIQSQSLLFYH